MSEEALCEYRDAIVAVIATDAEKCDSMFPVLRNG